MSDSTDAVVVPAAAADLPPADLDAILLCLSNRRRREVVEYLTDAREPVVVDELVRYILDEESGSDGADVTSADERAVRVELHHTHLPTLAAAKIVTYDPERSALRADEQFSAATAVLEAE